ncbi:chromate efflux transporter [Thalassotalea sp. ND16A]|uniref:chromate efflux transporter n=1 Tax=Thalassotalea sp. ND16A TaxID=1535422 RepID=UPI00051A76A1|nr:chromate efflux transporter [Thalassotalea sp. ND16A]KGJ88033.1 hypothetical protein ND16A_2586 [Thalassotalea sp. ND16A]
MKNVLEVFWQFLLLGLMSFGGPAAHIGYFQKTFVQQLKWLDDSSYARLISLSQFLPGPGSSQIGFAIGLQRAGLFGGIAAFIGFTLPSFMLLYLLASQSVSQDSDLLNNVIHGLKLLAVVVVADATLSMFNSFCTNRLAKSICIFSAVLLLLLPSLYTQMMVLVAAAMAGILFGTVNSEPSPNQVNVKWLPLVLFTLLFVGLPIVADNSQWLALLNGFYTSGSLVFGGGHVVLPLLQETLTDSVSTDRFLMGYAAAQAVPGPMFSVAAFLGADMLVEHSFSAALLATVAIFLPGFLLVLGLQGAWQTLAQKPKVAAAVWGINAGVVGLLLSALYHPVFTSAVSSGKEMALVLIGFFILRQFKLPIVALVLAFALIGSLW